MRSWLNGQTSPEMLYLETKWASLIPFARATDLLKEVLPVGDLVNAESVRNHLQLTAERIEQELGEERQLNRFEGSEQEWDRQPLPDGRDSHGLWRKSNWENLQKWLREALETKTPWQSDRSI